MEKIYGPREEAFARQDEALFRFFLHSLETRDILEAFKVQKASIYNKLLEGEDIAAVKGLLDLGSEILIYLKGFPEIDDKKSNEQKSKKEEEKSAIEEAHERLITHFEQAIDELESAFYDGMAKKDGDGKHPPLSCLQKNPSRLQTSETMIQFVGYELEHKDGTGEPIKELSFADYYNQYQTVRRALFDRKGPYFKLVCLINDFLDNQQKQRVEFIETLTGKIDEAITYGYHLDILEIKRAVKIDEREKDHVHEDSMDASELFRPKEADPAKRDMPLLTNNPFDAMRIFLSLAINTTDLNTRLFHMGIAITFIAKGCRFLYTDDDGNKQWFSIGLRKANEKRFDPVFLGASVIRRLNERLQKYQYVTKTEFESLSIAQEQLRAVLEKASGIIFTLGSYILSFEKSTKAKGSGSKGYEKMTKELKEIDRKSREMFTGPIKGDD